MRPLATFTIWISILIGWVPFEFSQSDCTRKKLALALAYHSPPSAFRVGSWTRLYCVGPRRPGAEVRRGRAVRSLQSHGRVWVAELKDGSKVSATDVFLATGKHDLRGWKRES